MTREEAINKWIIPAIKNTWNAKRCKEILEALEQESTTKNCRTCRNFGSHHGICEICKDNKCWTEKESIERYHSRNLKAYADEMGVSVEQAEKELLREEPTTKKDVPENNAGNIYICSCGYGWDKSKVVRYHFCPNCGKAVASATKNDSGVKLISKSDVDRIINCPYFRQADKLIQIMNLPPVTPQEQRWIPVKFRPLTDEEQDEYPDYCYMADCPMPDDGEEILVCTTHGSVEKDECEYEDGFYLDSGYDWQTDIVAWMPLPKPYEAESEDKE